MDDYLVLVLKNQKRLREVDPEQVKQRLEEQGAPGEKREEGQEKAVTSPETPSERSETAAPEEEGYLQKLELALGDGRADPVQAGSHIRAVQADSSTMTQPGQEHTVTVPRRIPSEKAEGRDSASRTEALTLAGRKRETGDGEEASRETEEGSGERENTLGKTEEETRERLLWQMERVLAEQTEEKSPKAVETDEKEADKQDGTEGTPLREKPGSRQEDSRKENSTPEREAEEDFEAAGRTEEQRENASARQILRRLETVEYSAAGKMTEERNSGTSTGTEGQPGTEYWGESLQKGYLRQIAEAVARRETTRMIRVTEVTARSEQREGQSSGGIITAYQTSWGEMDPEGLSRIFQRDARRYS